MFIFLKMEFSPPLVQVELHEKGMRLFLAIRDTEDKYLKMMHLVGRVVLFP